MHVAILVVRQAVLRHGDLDHFARDLVSVLRTRHIGSERKRSERRARIACAQGKDRIGCFV